MLVEWQWNKYNLKYEYFNKFKLKLCLPLLFLTHKRTAHSSNANGDLLQNSYPPFQDLTYFKAL